MVGGIQSKAAGNTAIATTNGSGTIAAPNAQQGAATALNNQKDAREAATDAKFGDVWKDMQAKYGAKAEKPREIKKSLGKDDFLRIMVTQMKHQDPTSPFKAEQFAAELAQFTSVEQLQNLNSAVSKMATQNHPLERMAMTNLIGKTVTVDRDRFPHTEGQNASLTYTLPRDAANVKVSVVSEGGEVVFEKEVGSQKAGENLAVWDGLKGGTVLPAKSGTYMLRIEAKDDRDQSIDTSSRGQAKIIGVSFEGPEPVFLVGDPSRPDKITMKNVVRIDEGGIALGSQASLVPGAQSLASAVQASASQMAEVPQAATPPAPAAAAPTAQAGGSNFFTFQKGKGSTNIDPSSLDQQAAAAIAKFEQQEKGFPNGLSGSGEEEAPNGVATREPLGEGLRSQSKEANHASGAVSQNGHTGNKGVNRSE